MLEETYPPDKNQTQQIILQKPKKEIKTQKLRIINNTIALKEILAKNNIFLTNNEENKINEVLQKYPMSINTYYLNLIKDKNDSIWNQCIPQIEEITDQRGQEDPLLEEGKIPFLTHRYPDRVLLLVSNVCAMYCRFCTRKRKVGEYTKNPTFQEILNAIEYIKEHKEIRDVILSGGDPLMLPDESLEQIIQEIRKINHIEIIRIGTRIPCVLPQRITQKLCNMLKKYNKDPALYINTHFEHPNEITPESKNACQMLSEAGIPLGNQSVLLKGVNDNPQIFSELNKKLLSIKVRPYYIYQADLVKGTYHFICNPNQGLEIIKNLRGFTSGLAVPHFVIDAPNGGGKIPFLPSYGTISESGQVNMTNYAGKSYEYKT